MNELRTCTIEEVNAMTRGGDCVMFGSGVGAMCVVVSDGDIAFYEIVDDVSDWRGGCP